MPLPILAAKNCQTQRYLDKKTHEMVSIKRCKQAGIQQKIRDALGKITPAKKSALNQKIKEEISLAKITAGLGYYEPTYIIWV